MKDEPTYTKVGSVYCLSVIPVSRRSHASVLFYTLTNELLILHALLENETSVLANLAFDRPSGGQLAPGGGSNRFQCVSIGTGLNYHPVPNEGGDKDTGL